ncbi:hypothetical protein MKZ38_008142 [Zalerion maritima]|uniref:Uncharacterized protein n=1 Tax=Zalerion maritima TaxID=339359 RepID=A0AAD5RHV6_9PEZI|nr:hypothetical protein MKZ38_008142 [Zalerion maritima]
MDNYLSEQHSYQLGRESQAEEEEEEDGLGLADRTSWVMLGRQGEIEPLPDEELLLKGKGRISIEFITKGNRSGRASLPPKCPDGKLYLTNQRVVYVAAKPTDTFTSFSIPILDVQDSNMASTTFGAWYWLATVTRSANGGIPPEHDFFDIKMSFRDGGWNNFYQKFVAIKARLHHAREIGASVATHGHLDPLPEYEARPEANSPSSSAAASLEMSAGGGGNSSRPPPDEPPPQYEEVQAQAVAESLDRGLRQTMERWQEEER